MLAKKHVQKASIWHWIYVIPIPRVEMGGGSDSMVVLPLIIAGEIQKIKVSCQLGQRSSQAAINWKDLSKMELETEPKREDNFLGISAYLEDRGFSPTLARRLGGRELRYWTTDEIARLFSKLDATPD